jgi:hypothetical protein
MFPKKRMKSEALNLDIDSGDNLVGKLLLSLDEPKQKGDRSILLETTRQKSPNMRIEGGGVQRSPSLFLWPPPLML